MVPGGQGGEDGDFVQLRVVREKVGPFIYDNLIKTLRSGGIILFYLSIFSSLGD